MKKKFSFNFILLHYKCNEISLVQGRYFRKALLLFYFIFLLFKEKKWITHINYRNSQFIVQTLYMIHILLVSNIRKGFLDIQLSCWNNFIINNEKKKKKTVIICIISQNWYRITFLEDNPCTQIVICNHDIQASVLLNIYIYIITTTKQ